jgi:predicted ArsR family transcriptional regulator
VVVCAVHKGMIAGALGASAIRVELRPFAAPDGCLLTLHQANRDQAAD